MKNLGRIGTIIAVLALTITFSGATAEHFATYSDSATTCITYVNFGLSCTTATLTVTGPFCREEACDWQVMEDMTVTPIACGTFGRLDACAGPNDRPAAAHSEYVVPLAKSGLHVFRGEACVWDYHTRTAHSCEPVAVTVFNPGGTRNAHSTDETLLGLTGILGVKGEVVYKNEGLEVYRLQSVV